MLTSANRIIETPKIFVINAIYIPPETTKDILLKNALCLIKQYILIIAEQAKRRGAFLPLMCVNISLYFGVQPRFHDGSLSFSFFVFFLR